MIDPHERERRQLLLDRLILRDEEDEVRQLPLEVTESHEFQSASLALRMVHQLLRPSLRTRAIGVKPDKFSATEAAVLQRMLASQSVFVRESEAEALIAEAVKVGLWERDKELGLLIYAQPLSTLPPSDKD